MSNSSKGHASAVDRDTAPHYNWGEVCDGWRLLAGVDLSVIEERVPPGAGEVRHHHARARQFFYILSGRATLEFDEGPVRVAAGQGIHVAPGVWHRFANHSDADVRFLVISSPSTKDDRVEQSTPLPASASASRPTHTPGTTS